MRTEFTAVSPHCTDKKPFLAFGACSQNELENLRQLAAVLKKERPIQTMEASQCEARNLAACEKAMIWANEIRGPLDAAGMPTVKPGYLVAPLEAAADTDTLGTLAGTLVTQRFLDVFMYKLPLISGGRIMTDFSSEPGELNQSTKTRKVLIPGVETFDNTLDTDGYPKGWNPASAAQTTDIDITLDELVGVPIPFSIAALSSTRRDLFGETAPAAAYALAKYFLQKIYGVCTAANFNAYANVTAADAQGIVKVPVAYATFPIALIDFARSKIADIGTAFDCNEVPDDDRTLLLNAQYYGKATQDPSIVTFFAGQQAPAIITQGVLPSLSGFSPIKAPNFPGSNNRVGIALQKNGLLCKSRIPSNLNEVMKGAGNGLISNVVHPETGMTFLLTQFVDQKRGYACWNPSAILGAAKGDIRGGMVLTSQ